MQTPVHRNRQPYRSWLLPAIVAAILLIGGVAGNLVASDLQMILAPYRIWVWISFGVALVVTIAIALIEARHATTHSPASNRDTQFERERLGEGSPSVTASAEGSVAVGRDIKESAIITGDENVAVVGSKVDGDVFGGDKITHIHEAADPIATSLHQLRAPVGDFVGREQELTGLIRALHDGEHVVISGMGGTGKTELALLVADRVSNDYPDAQLFINLQGNDPKPRRAEAALAVFIRAFLGPEAKLPDELDALTQLYRSQLSQKRVLIVLDNAADSAQVRPLLPPAGCALLVTSRQAVTLSGMSPLTLSPLTDLEAPRLLLEIAPRAAPVADEICQLSGYLPLAVRAAGSLLAVSADLDPADYASQLKEERTRLTRFGTEGVELGVEASFNLSYARLEPEAARVFRQLAVFPAAFDATAEQAICADVGHTHLSNLVRRSLVLYDVSSKRYRLHDLVRLFAGARLIAQERSDGQRLHAMHYQTVLADAVGLYLEGGQTVRGGLMLFDLEWRNIETGQAWAETEAGGNDQAALLCIAYPDAGAYVLALRQHPRERIRWLEAAVGAARRIKKRGSEGNALGNLGLAFANLGQLRRAIEFHEQALVIVREIGDQRGEGAVLGNLGSAYGNLGDTRRAITFLEQALGIGRELGDRRNEGVMLGNLGNVYAGLGETRRAVEFYEQNLAIAREIGDQRGEGAVLGNLGRAYGDLGETRRAIEFHEQALLIYREIGDRRTEGIVLGNLGLAYANLSETGRAIETYEQQLVIARELGDRRSEGNALGNLGLAYASLGETRRAIEFYEQQLVIVRDIGDRRGEGIALFNKSLVLDTLGERAQAIAAAEETLTIFEQLENPYAAHVREKLSAWRE